MNNDPEWIKKISDLAESIVLEGATLQSDETREGNEGSMRLASAEIEESSPAKNRHVFIMAIDTSNMKETAVDDERTVVSGIQNSEIMMGNADIVVACLIQFIKSRKMRPFLLRAILQGLDLGGLEQTVMPNNVEQFIKELASAHKGMDALVQEMMGKPPVADDEQTKE